MKTLKELLYITEDSSADKWLVSFKKPEFQGGDSEEISKEEAISLLSFLQGPPTSTVHDKQSTPDGRPFDYC